jgi:hypothetical protein
MNLHLRLLLGLTATLWISAATKPVQADSWIFQPSYFSHSPQTGERVAQYAEPAVAYARGGENYLQSGYRHNTIDMPGANGGGDHIHVVETWGLGDQIRPYGEWLYPFRPGAVPYGPWGYPQGPRGALPNPYGSMQGYPSYPYANPYGAGYGPGAGIGPGGPPAPYPYPAPYAAPGAGAPQAPPAPGAGAYQSPYGPPLLRSPGPSAPSMNN